MAVIDFTRSATAPRDGYSAVTSLYASFLSWNDARQARKALSALTDRQLDDIGLCRGDIEKMAQGGYRR